MQNLNVRNKLLLNALRQFTVTPRAADAVAVLAATELTATDQVFSDEVFSPDVPRCLSVTGKAGGVLPVAGDVYAFGMDANGVLITEKISLNADATVAGKNAFARVYEVQLPIKTNDGDTVSVGFTDVIGLPDCLSGDTVLLTTVDGAFEATRPAVTFDEDKISLNTVDPNTALGGKELCVYYIAEE
jgi:hypothetical protein